MAIEAIKEIKEAENKACEIIENARLNGKNILKEAKDKALDEYNNVINAARVQSQSIVEKAAIEAKKKSKPLLEVGEKEVEGILNTSQEKINKAVNLVIERIVKSNGNS